MGFIENASITINGGSTLKKIMDAAEEDHDIMVAEEEWIRLAGHSRSILLQSVKKNEKHSQKIRGETMD